MLPQIFGRYTVLMADHCPPQDAAYREHAALVEEKGKTASGLRENFLYLAVCQDDAQWPFLIVTQHYAPGPEAGFTPGVLILPETHLLFIGAGERLLAYRLDQPAKLWEDTAEMGFWRWQHYQDVLIMAAELELATWTNRGKKLWTLFVEPPWDYSLDGNTIYVEVMGTKASFPLYEGPPAAFRWP